MIRKTLIIFIVALAGFAGSSQLLAATIGVPVDFLTTNKGLLAWWTMDGSSISGLAVSDRSNSGNGVTISGQTSASVAIGRIGQALTFDGINDYMSLSGGGSTAPTFIQEAETAWDTDSDKTTSSFNVQAGDVLVAYSIMENQDGNNLMDISGGSLTWTLRQQVSTVSYTAIWVWTAVVDSDKSMTVTFDANTSNLEHFGGNVLTFRGSGGVGASSSRDEDGAGEVTLDITTTQANSAIVVASGDWDVTDGSSRAWKTGAGAFSEKTYFLDPTRYTLYGGYHADAGSIGTYTVGLSAPTGQKYSIGAVEVKGTSGGSISGIKTISFWAKPLSTTQSIMAFDGSKNIAISAGTLQANNVTSPTIYIDGVAGTTFPNTDWHHVTVTTGTAINASALTVGRVSSSYYAGRMDDVRMYDRVLTATEARQIYNMGTVRQGISAADPLKRGLQGWWTMDGKDMYPNVRDSSGNGQHGNLGGATTTRAGKIGQALTFDGTGNSYVQFPGISLGSTFTMSAWVNYRSCPLGWCTIVETTNPGNAGWLIQGGTQQLYPHNNSTTNIPTNSWHHLAIVSNGVNTTFYYDGRPDGTTNAANPATWNLLGSDGPSNDTDHMDGSVDDVRIYDRAMTAAEIKQLYNIGEAKQAVTPVDAKKTGLVGWWTFDGADMFPNVRDKSGNGQNGNWFGGATTTAIGKIGQAIKFDGTPGNYVRFPGINLTSVFSMAAWIKYTDCGSSFYCVVIGSTNTFNAGWYINGAGGKPYWYDIGSANSDVTVNTWHHIAMTGNGSSITFYLDGEPDGTVNTPGNPGTWTIMGSDAPVGDTDYLNGSLDDVRMYDRTLTAAEIRQLYNQGK